MTKADVILVSMPWEMLSLPSIQLGTLQSLLQNAGFRTESRTFYLALMQHFISSTRKLREGERITVDDYAKIGLRYYRVGMGDWIFAVPPYRDLTEEADQEYFAYLRSERVPRYVVARAVQMRRLVPAFLESCVEDILARSPDVVGFTSSFSQNVPSLTLAKLLKQRLHSVRIVFGGANCDGPMGAALHRTFPWVDAVVRGEGESVLPELIRQFKSGEAVRPQPGLCYREDGKSVVIKQAEGGTVPMNEVPIPNYDEYFERLRGTSFYPEVAPKVEILFESSRGCWWGEKMHCTFCGLNGSTMAFRSKSPDRVAQELISLAKKFRHLDFRAVDNIINVTYLRELLPRLRDSKFDLHFFYETKANLKKEQVRMMRDARVLTINPGIESLSNPILKLMKKGVTGLQNIRLLKWCAQYDLKVVWNVIVGFPGEPPREYDRMADVMRSLMHLHPPHLAPLGLERFSPYHQNPSAYGIKISGPAPYYRYLYQTDEASLSDLAYDFDYTYEDGRDPGSYLGAISEMIHRWQKMYAPGSLTYRRGPGFLNITDRRPNKRARDHSYGEVEAKVYLSCDGGIRPSVIWNKLASAGHTAVSLEDVKDILKEFQRERLVYEEEGQYLSLALPLDRDEHISEENSRSELDPDLVQIGNFPANTERRTVGVLLDAEYNHQQQ
ncbi:MAG TPA: RiPP maturation radical SAM C-methyltransferase [Pyrinomonadaceae bacterium]